VFVSNTELYDSLDSDSFYLEGADIADMTAPKVPITGGGRNAGSAPGWSIRPTGAS